MVERDVGGKAVKAGIAPWLSVGDADRAAAYYEAAFGAVERYRLEDETGQLVVARLAVGAADFWIQDDPAVGPETCAGAVRMILTVANPQAVHSEALKAGATEISPVSEGHGWLIGRLRDPLGHQWEVGRPLQGPEDRGHSRQTPATSAGRFARQNGNPRSVSVDRVREAGMNDSDRTHLKRFAVLVKSNAEVEAGAMPTEQDLAAMTRFNDELVESGAMLAGEGFLASADGARLTYTSGGVSVQSGPFTDPESLVAGYWIIQAASLDEAIDLMKGAPMEGATVEIRQVADADDFGQEFTPELREREERQRRKMEEENAKRRAA